MSLNDQSHVDPPAGTGEFCRPSRPIAVSYKSIYVTAFQRFSQCRDHITLPNVLLGHLHDLDSIRNVGLSVPRHARNGRFDPTNGDSSRNGTYEARYCPIVKHLEDMPNLSNSGIELLLQADPTKWRSGVHSRRARPPSFGWARAYNGKLSISREDDGSSDTYISIDREAARA